MSCIRCQGMMLEEHMIDMEADYGEMWRRSSRCVNCGHREDAVIRHHRQLHARPIAVSPPTVMVQETIELARKLESVEPLAA